MNGNTGYGETEKHTAAESMKPGFLGGAGGGEIQHGLNADNPGSGKDGRGAQNDLAEAEKAAENAGIGDGIKNSVTGARENEEKAGGLYKGSGRKTLAKVRPTGFRGIVKKGGPLYAILFSVFAVGGLMAGTQFFQPFSLVAQFQETFGSMQISANRRSERFFRAQMSTRQTKSPFSVFGTKFSLGKKQITELSKQGIEYDENYEGKGVKALKYTDDEGKVHVVVANESDAKKLGSDAKTFKRTYAENPEFFQKYNKGSMTWRGAIANWFGSRTSSFLKNNKLTRNMFSDYEQKKAQANGDGMEVVKQTLEARTNEIKDGGVKINQMEAEQDEDGNEIEENGKKKMKKTDSPGSESETISRKNIDTSEKLNKLKGKFTSAANIGCAAVGFIGAVSLLVSASEALQIINLTSAYFETFDKAKAGYGVSAPINELMTTLNEKKTNKNVVIEKTGEPYEGKSSFLGSEGDGGIKTLTTKDIVTEKTAMQSAGIGALYSGGLVDPNDPSVQSFNFSNSAKTILGGLGTSMAAFKACTVAKTAAAVISIGIDALSTLSCIAGMVGAPFTFGLSFVGGCGALALDFAGGVAAGVGMGVVLGGIIALITPAVSNMLTRDLVSNLGGEDLGNALASGGNMYLGSVHRSNGGSLSKIENYEKFVAQRNAVIAENARYERETLSPFDLTSKYTFMGSIATRLMGYMASNSLMNTIISGGEMVSSSLMALSPMAEAYDIAESLPSMEEYEKTCPYLASINAIGDSFCNSYVISDISTIEDDPDDVLNTVYNYGGLEDEESGGNVVIKKDSDLAKWIRYCNNRNSAFGIVDQNIANELNEATSFDTGSAVVDNAGNGLIGSVPIFGDVVDIIEQDKLKDNIGYVSGESCVTGNTLDSSESPNWNKAKYYQRFVEDQSLAESMGVIEKSAVSAYLDEYYEENPLDNSYEGILARYSGLEKDTVVALLDTLDYYNYIAQYDPSTRYAFGESEVEVEDGSDVMFEHEYVLDGEVVLLGEIIYADVRNRSYAV